MKDLIESYINEIKLNGKKAGTIEVSESVLRTLEEYIQKPIEQCTAEDIKKFLTEPNQYTGKTKAPNTLNFYKIRIRLFFNWLKKPEIVDWMEVKTQRRTLDDNKLLTADEIELMLKAAKHPRDRALIAMLTETGARITELLNLNIEDLIDTEYGMEIRIKDLEGNKTGARKIPIIECVQHIKKYLNQYPKPSPEKPLFVSFKLNRQFNRLSYEGVYLNLKEIAKDAGIKKKVHPHQFRHTQLTDMVRQGYNESIIRKKAGWVGDSRMISIYLHATDKDVETAMLAKHGLRQIQQASPQMTLTKECPQCHRSMPIDAQYCETCSKHQDLSPVVKRLLEENQENHRRITELERKGDEILKMVLAQGKVGSVKS